MAEQVRVGIIGTSGYTDGFLIGPLVAHPRAVVTALCGRNQARAQELAAKHAIPSVFADYRELYAHGGLDAVVISSRTTCTAP